MKDKAPRRWPERQHRCDAVLCERPARANCTRFASTHVQVRDGVYTHYCDEHRPEHTFPRP